jgi:two-component system sensor histidine kinase BarA
MSQKEIIDWDLAIERADGKEELAKELLNILIKTLPQHQDELKTAFENNDTDALHAAAHKLHSATCYCGTPRLKNAARDLEDISKSNDNPKIKESYQKLQEEITAVLQVYKKL